MSVSDQQLGLNERIKRINKLILEASPDIQDILRAELIYVEALLAYTLRHNKMPSIR